MTPLDDRVGPDASEDRSLKVFLRGNAHLRDALLSRADGGAKLVEGGVIELIESATSGDRTIETMSEDCQGVSSFLAALRVAVEGSSEAPAATACLEFKPDIVVLSVEPDLTLEPGDDQADFRQELHEVIRFIKEHMGSHLLVLTASTVDPVEMVSNYHGLSREPRALRAHRLDLAVLQLSYEEGISLIDADRILAELGAGEHVIDFLDYSSTACAALAAEFVRIVDEYGFLDDRPLIPQVGRSQESA